MFSRFDFMLGFNFLLIAVWILDFGTNSFCVLSDVVRNILDYVILDDRDVMNLFRVNSAAVPTYVSGDLFLIGDALNVFLLK